MLVYSCCFHSCILHSRVFSAPPPKCTTALAVSFCGADCQVGQTQRKALRLIHTATPDTTKLSCLCRVRFGGVNWIPDNSGLSPKEKVESEHVRSNCPIHAGTPDTTQTGAVLSCLVWRCERSTTHAGGGVIGGRAGNYTTSRVDITALVLMNSER